MGKRCIAIMLLAAATALGVSTSYWSDGNQADFKKGTLHNVVATNLGDVKLSRALKTLLEEDPRVSAVYALAEGPDGAVYAATGPQGVLLQLKDEKVKTVAVLDGNENLSALLFDGQGRLWIGTCGSQGRILRLDHPDQAGAKPQEIFAPDGVQYIWALQLTGDGKVYAATGPTGQLYEIDPDGTKSVLFHSDENNLLSMVSDGKDLLYVGTDPNGLVYRINRKTKDVFVLYNAAESEVSCLALDGKGNLYVGTGQEVETAAEEGKAAGPAPAPEGGRPEGTGGTGGVPIPGQPPENPKPPPQPNPGEPAPIPGGAHHATGAPRAAGPAASEWMRGPVELAMGADAADDDPNGPNNPAPEPIPGQPGKKEKAPPASQPAGALPAVPAPERKAQGNAIYRIDAQGFVKEIFRAEVTVYSMIERNGVLLVGTGDGGVIYQIDPAAEETIEMAKVEPKDVMTMLAAKDGRVILGLADVGGLAAMSAGYASEGTFTSSVLDATQVSLFGKIHLVGTLPEKTALTVATRSGNVQDANKAGWTAWTAEAPAQLYMETQSPAARFLQYRLTFTSADGRESPVVRQVDVAYQMPNLAPVVKAVKVSAAGGKSEAANGAGAPGGDAPGDSDNAAPPRATAPGRMQLIEWEADDADGDALQYTVYFRLGALGPWVLVKDQLTETHYLWDTRTVADGRYQVKVVASNAMANAPGEGLTGSRVSDPLVVDNTPPVIGDLKAQAGAGGTVQVEARVVDRTTTVALCEYSVDSSSRWQTVLPVDRIYDSPQAKVSFTVSGLTAGAHQVTLRATDAKGNQSYETIQVTIPSP